MVFGIEHYIILLQNSFSVSTFRFLLSLYGIVGIVITTMATTFKGIYKSLKYITQIFVVKEREMEIGYPTDVKHVAHVGWDGPLGSGPSWMDDFKTAPNFTTSLDNLNELRDPNPMAVTTLWSSQESEQSSKAKQKKIKSTSSSQSPSASSRRSRSAKSKATYSGREATPIALV